jgi:epoxyqueuosine reductase
VLDARKCISYLTIELKGPIPLELRDGVGDWLFGCDLCQEVCPWNRKAPATVETAFQPQQNLNPADCLRILQMTRAEFDHQFDATPMARPGYEGLRRNAAIVLGNRRDTKSIPVLINVLDDVSPVVRGAAAWALGKLAGHAARVAVTSRLATETDPGVREELIRSQELMERDS